MRVTASRVQVDNRLQPRALRLLSAARQVLHWEPGQDLHARWVPSPRGEILEVRPYQEGAGLGWTECRLRRNGGAKGAEAIFINCRALLKELHEISPLCADPLHAEVEGDSLRVYLREPITPEAYGLRVYGDRRQKKQPVLGKRHEVHIDLMLYEDTLRALESEAQAAGMPLRYYLRQVIEQRQPIQLKHAEQCQTHQERAHIVKKAMQADHTLSAEELQRRGLPLCWNEHWLREQLAQGKSYTQMAEEFGGGSAGVYAYWGRKYGISRDRREVMQAAWDTRKKK